MYCKYIEILPPNLIGWKRLQLILFMDHSHMRGVDFY